MSNIKVIKTNSIIINNKVIVYDVFYSNSKKCIAVIVNPGFMCIDEIGKIKLYLNSNGTLSELICIGSDAHHSRPCDCNEDQWTHTEVNIILYYEYKGDLLVIEYENDKRELKIINVDSEDESQGFMLSTIVHLPCYHGICQWITYHKKLGINNYSFYLNDFSDERLNEVIQIVKDIEDVSISIIDWNFPYLGKFGKHSFHGAQVQCFNHALHFFNYKSYILTDVDEYLITNSISDILEKYKDYPYIVMENKWAKKTKDDNLFGSGDVYVYDSARDASIVKNIIIDRNKIKVALVHGSFAYDDLSPCLAKTEDIYFIHYLDMGEKSNWKKDRIYNGIMGTYNERILNLG